MMSKNLILNALKMSAFPRVGFQSSMPLAWFGRAKPKVSHYTPFEEKDFSELKVYDDEKLMDKQYKRIRDEYQNAAIKKTHRRERIAEIKAERPENVAEHEKLVIHNPAVGIEYPPQPDQIFAVIEILGFQYKVVQDDILTVDSLGEYDINDQIVFENVLLVGSPHFTAVGRPYVTTAKVYATVEEQTQGEKVIGLHMRRRKTSRKSWGHRQLMTVIRIDKVEVLLTETEFSNAVAL